MTAVSRPTWAPYVAMWRVEELLRRATQALNAAGVPYAVVGGNAVAAWVATIDPDAIRATKDVDLLARRECLAEMSSALEVAELQLIETNGIWMFVEKVDPSPKRAVHLIFEGEKIAPHYAHPSPKLDEIRTDIAAYPVVELRALLIMKLQSFRDIDRAHVRDMMSVGLITEELAGQLPRDMLLRLREIQAKPERTL